MQLDGVAVEDVALGEQLLVGALVVQVGQHFLAAEDRFETLEALVGENADLVGEVRSSFSICSCSICLARSSFS